jgi:predicted nucleic acid-binding Zn ribbon protein
MLPKAVTYEAALRAAKAQAALRDWEGIVGEALAQRSRPDRYRKGTVWVAVSGSAWAQEMRMRKETILARLRERAGDPGLFLDVRFGVRPLPPRETPIAVEATEVDPPNESEDLSIREMADRRLRRMRGE